MITIFSQRRFSIHDPILLFTLLVHHWYGHDYYLIQQHLLYFITEYVGNNIYKKENVSHFFAAEILLFKYSSNYKNNTPLSVRCIVFFQIYGGTYPFLFDARQIFSTGQATVFV